MSKVNTVVEIEKILSDYFQNGSTQSIDRLLDMNDKLAIHSYRLAEMSAQTKTSYNSAYFIRKITVNKQTQVLMSSKKMTKVAANLDADILSEDLFKQEIESEGLAYQYDLLLNQVNKILSAISQRISYLKNEKDHFKTNNRNV